MLCIKCTNNDNPNALRMTILPISESCLRAQKEHTFSSLPKKLFSLFALFPQISTGEAYLVYSKRVYSNSDFNQYVAALYKVVGTFLFGACVSQSLTDLAKFTIGRPRPNFMAVCQPKACTGYMQEINCTGKLQDVTESR